MAIGRKILALKTVFNLDEIRCSHCERLLGTVVELEKSEKPVRLIEIKCKKCGTVNRKVS